VYDARYGFNAERRQAYDAPSALLAQERTLGFLNEHLMVPPVYEPEAVIGLPSGLANADL
jgi:hypothetical protein